MLKTLRTKLAEPKKDIVMVGGDSRAERDGSKLDGDGVNGGKVGNNEIRKKGQNLFKSKKIVGLDFFTSGARLAFIKLR